jgi:hypothetical protein
MSIREEIKHRMDEGRLFLLSPAISLVVRPMFVSQEIKDLVLGPWNDPEWAIRCGLLRADLDRFITGARIPVAARPYQARSAYIAQLDQPRDEAWEIRSRDPEPSIRVFGRFAMTNWFVALTWSKRADLEGPDSREWRDAIETCKAEWRKLFPTYDPKTGDNVHDYISAKYFLV